MLDDDMDTALAERRELIEAGAHRLLHHALKSTDDWVRWLGKAPDRGSAHRAWMQDAATIALYRYRYDIVGADPLGDAKHISVPEQSSEFRRAAAALRHLHTLNNETRSGHHRVAPTQTLARGL